MDPKKHINAAEKSAHVRHGVVGAGAVIAAAAIVLLPPWAPTSEEVMAGGQAAPEFRFEAVTIDIDRANEPGARRAERLAGEHDTWLRDAHTRLKAPGQEEPLPPQF